MFSLIPELCIYNSESQGICVYLITAHAVSKPNLEIYSPPSKFRGLCLRINIHHIECVFDLQNLLPSYRAPHSPHCAFLQTAAVSARFPRTLIETLGILLLKFIESLTITPMWKGNLALLWAWLSLQLNSHPRTKDYQNPTILGVEDYVIRTLQFPRW